MQFSLQPVRLPELEPDDVLIRTCFSGVSIGTEFALIRNKISWGPYPLCTGYMASGIIEECGEAIHGFQAGDRVYYRNCRAMSLMDGQAVSSVTGTHCSYCVTKVGGLHGVGLLPKGADMECASMFVMPAVGYAGVDMAAPRLGDKVVVFGSGLIGLGVIAAASLRGCQVVAVDVQDAQLERAKRMGADVCINSAKENPADAIKAICPEGADAVFECTGMPTLVKTAMELCRLEGTFVWQGNYGAEPIGFDFLTAHNRRLRTFFPCDDGYAPCREVVVKHMRQGLLPWRETLTHQIGYEELPKVYERILAGDKSYLGVTVRWS